MYDILIGDFLDTGWLGIVLMVLIWILVLSLVGMLLYGIFYLCDSAFLPVKHGTGTIVAKHHTSSYTTHGMIMAGKVMVPTTQYHPERFEVVVSLPEGQDSADYGRNYYGSVKVGDTDTFKYVLGRFSNSVYLK